jgi:ribosome biogenesis GTPase / thiamine phosphate phosphatase
MSTILKNLGFNAQLVSYIQSNNLAQFEIGRVVRESKKKYIVKTEIGNFHSQISGNLRHTAKNRSDYPAVGDWVLIKTKEHNTAIIHHILPRKTIIERQAISRFGKKQTIATNVDVAFIMQDVSNDFNMNRLDRFLAICFGSQIEPIIILTKIDLMEKSELSNNMNQIKKRFIDIQILQLSNKSLVGFSVIKDVIKYGRTYCFIGASGAGKSTLLNNLIGEKVMLTKALREKSQKGQHTTSHRELFILENSGILIDTPGMRELGITESAISLKSTFKVIFGIAINCKFSDCKHINEPYCAVINALENGELDKSFYDNFQKMKLEQKQFTLSKKGLKDKEMIKNIKVTSAYKKKSK